MKFRVLLFISLSLVFFLTWSSIGWSQTPREEAETTAQHLATLLNVGRLVVDRNQTRINDPRKGDKGFTPEVFEPSPFASSLSCERIIAAIASVEQGGGG
jgi:hypothetical protein